jgi:hypothetical protein
MCAVFVAMCRLTSAPEVGLMLYASITMVLTPHGGAVVAAPQGLPLCLQLASGLHRPMSRVEFMSMKSALLPTQEGTGLALVLPHHLVHGMHWPALAP